MKKTYTEFMTKLEKIKKIKQEKKVKLAKRISMSVVATCLVVATTFGVQNSSKLFNLTGNEDSEVSAITAEAESNGDNNASGVAVQSEGEMINVATLADDANSGISLQSEDMTEEVIRAYLSNTVADIYVSTIGDDTTGDGTAQNPYTLD